MAAAPLPTPLHSLACPACGQQLGVRAEDVGRRGRCHRCGAIFRIGGAAPDATASAPPVGTASGGVPHADANRPPPTPNPEFVSFSCELCQTRLTARVADVGRTLKCPDCGRRNTVPPPPVRKPPQLPIAMQGEQYGLWEIDQAPSPEELAGSSKRLHPVVCELCQTLMYATDEQIGKKLKCPDCNKLTVAHARPPEKPKGPVIVPDGDEYQLDPASAPTPRQASPPPTRVPEWLQAPVHADHATAPAGVDDWRSSPVIGPATSDADAGAPSRRKPLGVEPPPPRPELPTIPLVQGALRMVLTSEILSRWAVLSLTFTVAGWFVSWVLSAMGSQVFLAIPLFAVGCVLVALWLLSALPLLLMIVTESSEGNDKLDDPPFWLTFDFAEAFFVVVPAALSAFPAWLSTKATAEAPWETQLAIAVGMWFFFFPIALLSALEQSSLFAVFSPRLGLSLLRCAGPWLLFYVESAMLVAAAGGGLWLIAGGPPAALLAAPWVLVAAALVYFRLLGRLAWWIAETMPPLDEDDAG